MPALSWNACRHPRESVDLCLSSSCGPRIKSGVTVENSRPDSGNGTLRISGTGLNVFRSETGIVRENVVFSPTLPGDGTRVFRFDFAGLGADLFSAWANRRR